MNMDTISEHLKSRHLDVSRYSISVSEEERTATFLLHNLSGRLIGFQQYRPDTKDKHLQDPSMQRYWTIVSHQDKGKDLAVFGLETIDVMHDKVIFLVEGVFDACRLHNLGLPCLAVLCNDPKHLANWLYTIPAFKIGIIDFDKAGKKLSNVCDYVIMPTHKDLGEMTEAEIKELLGEWL